MSDTPFTPASNSQPNDENNKNNKNIKNHENNNVPAHESRDNDVATRLNNDPVPDHGPGFWSDLQARLDAEASTAEPTNITVLSADSRDYGQEADRGPNGTATNQTAPNVIPIEARSSRRPMSIILSAAAAIVMLVVGAVFVLNRADTGTPIQTADETEQTGEVSEDAEDSDSKNSDSENSDLEDSVSEDSVSEDSDSENSKEEDPTDSEESLGDTTTGLAPIDFELQSATPVGPGSFVAFTSDGSGFLVEDLAQISETGCEGGILLELMVHNLTTATRTPALPNAMMIETGGVDLRIYDPSGKGPVTFVEFCDGVPFQGWAGVLGADGKISDVETVEIDEQGNPAGFGADPGTQFPSDFSPDGLTTMTIEDGAVRISTVDGAQTWDAPAEIEATDSGFHPSGEIVVITAANDVWLWNYRTGETAGFDYANMSRPQFNRAGNQLALTTRNDAGMPETTILTFNDGTVPTEPASTQSCSGDNGLPPFDPDALVQAGVPAKVTLAAAVIDDAAATCNWSLLEEVMADDFTASFGGDPGIDLWQRREAEGYGPMNDLRLLLRQPVASAEGSEPAIYVWPAVHTRADGCEGFTDEDLQSLAELGYSDEAIRADCEIFGGYAGWRMGISENGSWLYYVVGD